MKKTAVDWLFEKMTILGTNPYWDMKFKEAKQKEKEQIEDAYWDGIFNGEFLDGQGYYHENYEKK
jgi:hypothetical protein